MQHEHISDAAVIGLPDEAAGELPRAYVVAKPGTEITAEEVKRYVKGIGMKFISLRFVMYAQWDDTKLFEFCCDIEDYLIKSAAISL